MFVLKTYKILNVRRCLVRKSGTVDVSYGSVPVGLFVKADVETFEVKWRRGLRRNPVFIKNELHIYCTFHAQACFYFLETEKILWHFYRRLYLTILYKKMGVESHNGCDFVHGVHKKILCFWSKYDESNVLFVVLSPVCVADVFFSAYLKMTEAGRAL